MVWSRIFAAAGASLAVLSALILVLWGGATMRVFSVLDVPLPGLNRELNLTALSAKGLALGLTVVIYGLAQARRRFPLEWTGKGPLIFGGVLVAVGAVMQFSALRWMQGNLEALGAVQAAPTGDDLLKMVSGGVQRLTLSAFAQFSAVILVSIGVWKLFWMHGGEPNHQRKTFWLSTMTVGMLGALTFGLLYHLAVRNGLAALALAQAPEPPRPLPLATHLSSLITYAEGGSICLVLAGIAVTIIGLGFRSWGD